MAKSPEAEVLLAPVFAHRLIAIQVLGICSALAVTTQLVPTVVMCLAVTLVMALGNAAISLIRLKIPPSIHRIVQITIIASLVIVVEEFLQAFAFGVSQKLSVFVGLIVTNAILWDRIQGFAIKHDPKLSFLDGIGNGLALSMILLLVGTLREFFGSGQLFGWTILTADTEGGWYVPNGLMLLPPSALFILGLMIWILRTIHPEQGEEA